MTNLMLQMQIQFITGVILLLLLRPLLAKFPRIISYGLWCVLFLRLLCPFSLSLEQSPWPVQNTLQVTGEKLYDSEKQEKHLEQWLNKTAAEEKKAESKKVSLEERIEATVSETEEPYKYMADITHDGKADAIILNLEAIQDESKASGDEKTVVVKSAAAGQEIASYTANTIHGGWNGIYVYTDDSGDYLVNWRPAMYQGMGNYQLKVYSLNEDGTENILLEKTYQFDLNPGNFHFKPKAYQKYIDEVNQYLQKSYVIIDTDQGEAKYSADGSKQFGFYDGSEVMESYRDIYR